MLRLLLALIGLALVTTPAAASEVRALILASSYAQAENSALRLVNTVVDGRAIAAALGRAGLRDVRLVEEPDLARWEAELSAFLGRLGDGDIALVYYAGHAIQVSGRNYFLAGDGLSLIDVERMMPRLTERARGTILIVDACRDNPFRRGDAPASIEVAASRALPTVSIAELTASHRGLSQLGDLRGMSAIVFFSTEPGNVAEDGPPGAGSPFANAAVEELRRRQSLDAAFRRIAVRVNRATQGRQSPWRQGDLPFDVYIAGMQGFPVP